MNPDYFNRPHRQITWADMYPRQRAVSDAPTQADLDRLDAMEQNKLDLQERPIKGDPDVAAAPSNQSLDVYNKGWSAELEAQGKTFDGAVKRIEALPLTRQGVEIAKELDTDAIQFIDAVDKSQGRKLADAAHQLHIFHTGILKRLKAGPESVRSAARSFLIRFDQEQKRKLREEQAAREAEIRRQQEEERKAELAALEAAGATTEEAKVLEETPLPPVAAPPPKEAAKIENVSIVYAYKLKRIADPVKLMAFLKDRPEMILTHFDIKASVWKKWITDHADKATGQLSFKPEDIGIEIEADHGTRHRTSNGD